MIASLRRFFDSQLRFQADESPAQHEKCLRLATAALLIEMSLCDRQDDDGEVAALLTILRRKYGLADEELNTLVALAREEAKQATSLYEFTHLFNEHYDYPQKLELITHLWEIAYADGRLDSYEEHTVRRIADLLYVSHNDFIRSKLAVRDALAEE